MTQPLVNPGEIGSDTTEKFWTLKFHVTHGAHDVSWVVFQPLQGVMMWGEGSSNRLKGGTERTGKDTTKIQSSDNKEWDLSATVSKRISHLYDIYIFFPARSWGQAAWNVQCVVVSSPEQNRVRKSFFLPSSHQSLLHGLICFPLPFFIDFPLLRSRRQ